MYEILDQVSQRNCIIEIGVPLSCILLIQFVHFSKRLCYCYYYEIVLFRGESNESLSKWEVKSMKTYERSITEQLNTE